MFATLFSIIFFSIIPVLGIVLCFVNDNNKRRKKIINFILLINTLIYLVPLVYAFLTTGPNGNMWSENGSGAVLWAYLFLIPVCGLVLIILLVLKVKFAAHKPKSSPLL